MNKTLHKKLTEKHIYQHTPTLSCALGEEQGLIQEIAKDLMQPRPQAIAKLLKMAKDL